MKKMLITVMSAALIVAMAISVGAAFTPVDGWELKSGDVDGITYADGVYTFKDVNDKMQNVILAKKIEGNFRFEAEATAPLIDGAVDNWISVGVLGSDPYAWADTGFRFQIASSGIRIGDFSNGAANMSWFENLGNAEIKTGSDFNKIVIEVVGTEARFEVNGTEVGKYTMANADAAGSLLSFGINYWKGDTYDFGEAVIKNITITEIDAFTETEAPTSSAETSSVPSSSDEGSKPVSSVNSSSFDDEETKSGCGNKAE